MSKQVLVVAAHPDDEVLGCGGVMARHAGKGEEVHVVFMADGVGARKLRDGDGHAERVKSTEDACTILGVKSLHYLNLPDNKMDSLPLLDIVQKLENIVELLKPSVVYTHHAGDLNIDHRLTYQAAITACRPLPDSSVRQIYTFEVLSSTEWQAADLVPFVPNMFVDIGDYMEKKLQALKAYEKEMRQPPHSRSIENVKQLSAYRGHSVGVNYAEAFMVARILN